MKHLILDAGGVLVYPRLGAWHVPCRAAEILGPERAADLDTERFRAAHAACMPWLDESRVVMDVETERQLRRGFVLELDRKMGWHMTDREIADMTDDFTDDIDRYGFFDDLKPWLARWSGEYTVSLLSDAMPSLPGFLEQYGVARYFDEIVISTHIGAIKPSPKMYGAILKRLGGSPGDCLFVDDRPCNVCGAVDAGMAAALMDRPEWPAEGPWDGPVAHDFAELNALMEAMR